MKKVLKSKRSAKAAKRKVPTNGQKRAFDPLAFLAKVGEGKTITKFRKNQIVFSQSEPAEAVFYIQKGRIELIVVSTDFPRPELSSSRSVPRRLAECQWSAK